MPYPVFLRERLGWFPTINYSACHADLQCVNNCPNNVFAWGPATRRPFVLDPHNCSPGCDICLQNCVNGAISLPTREQWQASLRRLRAQGGTFGKPAHLIKWGC